MQHDDDLQAGGKLDAEVFLDKGGNKKEYQHQQTDEHAVVIAAQDGQHHGGNNQQAQYSPYDKGLLIVPDDCFQITDMIFLLLFCHTVCSPLFLHYAADICRVYLS